jgi:glutamine synthetase
MNIEIIPGILPWSPGTGWMPADLHDPHGRAIPFCTRTVLAGAVSRLAEAGMAMVCGLEVEFAVYRVRGENLEHHHAGRPGQPPETALIAQGYQYLTENTFDRLEPVMELIRQHAQVLSLPLRTMEAEFGPSQFEMTFEPGDPLTNADNMALFRSMVKQVCAREGLHATFMCRPGLPHAMGNGWHLHQSVVDIESGRNLFVPEPGGELSSIGGRWLAGLLARGVESCLLTTPTVNGYKRYQPYALAPDRVQWGRDNRGAMIRSLCRPGDSASRLENRVGEPAANPYLYIASQLLGGLDGVQRELAPPPPVEAPYETAAERLPDNLGDAIDRFDGSDFWRRALGQDFVDYYVHIKRAEWRRFMQWVTDWEQREYFSLY